MSRKDLKHGFSMVDNAFILHFDREVYRKFYPTIDFASFQIVESNGSTFHYFRDKNHVYLESFMNPFTILPEANPADFKILDFKNGIASSNDHDYVFDQKVPYRLKEAKALSEYYQQVNDKIYFNYCKEVKGVDPKTFEVLYGESVKNVAKDKNHVYFRELIVNEADAETFQFLDACFTHTYYRECDHTYYAKDKNYAFYVDTIDKAFKIIKTKSLDQFRFEIVDELGYGIDDRYQYLFGKRSSLKR